jgi:hypothetical protein
MKYDIKKYGLGHDRVYKPKYLVEVTPGSGMVAKLQEVDHDLHVESATTCMIYDTEKRLLGNLETVTLEVWSYVLTPEQMKELGRGVRTQIKRTKVEDDEGNTEMVETEEEVPYEHVLDVKKK